MASASAGIYRFTAIGRPLDMRYPTNRAVAMLAPLAGLIAGGLAVARADSLIPTVMLGVSGLAVAFGSWALARELAPDYAAAAFVSMAFGFATLLIVESTSVLLLFATMFLVRIVNRSVGLPARVADSILVAGFTAFIVYATRSPQIGAVGALAFMLDAVLAVPRRRQLVFAFLCLVAAVSVDAPSGSAILGLAALAPVHGWIIALVGAAYAAVSLSIRRVAAVGDATQQPLSVQRVRAGMVTALLMALIAATEGAASFETTALLWATLAGVVVGTLGTRFGNRVMTERSVIVD